MGYNAYIIKGNTSTMSTFTEPTISDVKESCYDLAMQLTYLDKSRFSVREVSKFQKLVSDLLTMDSILDDHIADETEDFGETDPTEIDYLNENEDEDESFLNDPNDKASRHHY